MKIRYAVFLFFLSLQTYAIDYTVHWKYQSPHVSYDVKTIISREGETQLITHKFPPGFSYSILKKGYNIPNNDMSFLYSAGTTFLTATGGDFSHQVIYQHATTNLEPVNLLAYMAQILNGQQLQLSESSMVAIPYLPVGLFPGSASYHGNITKVRINVYSRGVVHARVALKFTNWSTYYNVYLYFKDGKYYVVVTHQTFDAEQVELLANLHLSATDQPVTLNTATYEAIGLHEPVYQFAIISSEVFQGLTDVTAPLLAHSLPEMLQSSTPETEGGGCCAAFINTLVKIVVMIFECWTCQHCHRDY